MDPKEKALRMCQSIGVVTLFDFECNGGVTLPLHVSQKIAHIVADECFKEAYKQGNEIATIREEYWKEVKKQIDLL